MFSILISTINNINFDENALVPLFINCYVWAFVNFIIKNYKVLVGFILYYYIQKNLIHDLTISCASSIGIMGLFYLQPL